MRKNGFFIAAGILSILEAIGMVISSLTFIGLYAILNKELNAGGAAYNIDITNEELQLSAEVLRTVMIAMIVVCAIVAVFSIINATVYLKNSDKTYAELHEKSGKFITVIVISFIFGTVVCGIIGLLGYINKPTEESRSNAADSEIFTSSNSDEISKKLQQLKDMRESGIISDEEYQKAREEVLKKF